MTIKTIVHMDTHKSWRGGQRQCLELIKGLNERNFKNILVCKPGSEISQRARAEGVTVIHLPLRGEWDVYSALKLRSYINKEGVNIIHAHTSHAHMIALLSTVKLSSCKLVVSRRVDFHIDNFFSRKIKYGPSVDKIIAVSDAVRRILIEDKIDPKRVTTVRSGFVLKDLTKNDGNSNIREKLGISVDTPVITSVAALAPHKAHYMLLKAARIVLEKHPETKFLLAGEGELRDNIEKNIYNLGLEKSVILLGFIDDVASVYRATDIFALSSREEALCTSILDAMYFGLPLVTTNAGGIPELVHDGVNGMIVPVDDHVLFAEKLIFLIENPDRREKMGKRSSEILDQNRIEQTIEKTIEVYNEL